eukprot:1159079-Pelagomonas_calceolata.AAC.5
MPSPAQTPRPVEGRTTAPVATDKPAAVLSPNHMYALAHGQGLQQTPVLTVQVGGLFSYKKQTRRRRRRRRRRRCFFVFAVWVVFFQAGAWPMVMAYNKSQSSLTTNPSPRYTGR